MQEKRRALQVHYDDSSDEESGDEEGDYGSASEKFTEQMAYDPILINHAGDLKSSFDIFYFGLMLYHAPAVRVTYAASKARYLSKSIIPSNEKLLVWLCNAVESALKKELQIKGHKHAFQKYFSHLIESLSAEILQFVDVCSNNLRNLIRSAIHGVSLTEVIEEEFNTLLTAVSDFISDDDNYSCLLLSDYSAPPRVNEQSLFRCPAIYNWIQVKCQTEMAELDQVHVWVTQNQFPQVSSVLSPGKKISSSSSAKKNCDKILSGYELKNSQKYYIRQIKALGAAASTNEFLSNIKAQRLLGHLKEIVDLERARVGSILQQDRISHNADLTQSAFAEFSDLLDDFMPCDHEIFRDALIEQLEMSDILSEFCVSLKDTACTLEPDISRQTLPIFFQHSVNSCVEHIVSLKLTNRSIVRTYRNQSQLSLLGKDKEENQDFGWKFPASDTYMGIERNRVTNNARTALVPMQTMSNAYSDIADKITILKNNLQINDQVIGLWVRQVLQFQKLIFNFAISVRNREDLVMFIIQVAHLLGGTECMRYPGALIQHQMALDLIIAGLLTWNEALNPAIPDAVFLPMSMGKATNVSRGLIITYAKSSRYKHHYPGDGLSIATTEVKYFIAAEKRLSDKWFRFYKESAEAPAGNQLSEAIKEAIPEWFPGLEI